MIKCIVCEGTQTVNKRIGPRAAATGEFTYVAGGRIGIQGYTNTTTLDTLVAKTGNITPKSGAGRSDRSWSGSS